jgi:hypothetical protein
MMQQEGGSLDLQEFANILFNNPVGEPKSKQIDITHLDETCTFDFLQDLFLLGKNLLFGSSRKLTMTHFETIKSYIQSIGYDTILVAYKQDENNEITGILLNFKLL